MIEHITRPKRELIPLTLMLGQFAEQKKISTYGVCNRLKSTQYKRAYANIRSRIRTLLKQKLIERTDKAVPPRAANYFTLTALGIEYLIADRIWLSNDEGEAATQLMRIIKNYGDQMFFEIFGYQFLERDTLKQIRNPNMIGEIFEYFTRCVRISRGSQPPLVRYSSLTKQEWERLAKYFSRYHTSRYAEKMALTLIEFSDTENLPRSLDTLYLDEDLRLLAHDPKFLKLLAQARGRLDMSYKKFIKYQK